MKRIDLIIIILLFKDSNVLYCFFRTFKTQVHCMKQLRDIKNFRNFEYSKQRTFLINKNETQNSVFITENSVFITENFVFITENSVFITENS